MERREVCGVGIEAGSPQSILCRQGFGGQAVFSSAADARKVLEFREGNYDAPVPTMESHRFIRKAREYFFAKFDEKFAQLNNQQGSHNWALRIQRVLTKHVSVVAVFSEDEDNAANVFETLNDRGIGLSTPDLLRNLLLRRAIEEQREEIIGLWGQILEIEDDVNIKTFLRHYWISHKGDVKTQSLYREIKDDITANNVSTRWTPQRATIYGNSAGRGHERLGRFFSTKPRFCRT